MIFTPFAAVLDALPGIDSDAGWWRVRIHEDVTLVQVPQGSACVDGVLALEADHEVTFVGICGLVCDDETVPVGTIVEPVIATAFDGTVGRRRWPRPPVATPVTVATVGFLAASSQRHHELATTAACVDMETAWVLAAGEVTGCLTRAILSVSDANQEGAVFDTQYAVVVAGLTEATQRCLRAW